MKSAVGFYVPNPDFKVHDFNYTNKNKGDNTSTSTPQIEMYAALHSLLLQRAEVKMNSILL